MWGLLLRLLVSSEQAKWETCLPSRSRQGIADRRWGSLVITLRRSAGTRPGVGDEEVLGGAMSSILEVFYDDGAVDGRGVVVGCLLWSV
jgi:hypothetical protein